MKEVGREKRERQREEPRHQLCTPLYFLAPQTHKQAKILDPTRAGADGKWRIEREKESVSSIVIRFVDS